ncbi:VTT domain-containing protein [Cellulomonas edaphi]|uniref:VTT domain-containing protein n=1 Tax=Cellulomonas edaphi TaxID=3053468 RepID=A0ABT7S297_9CELL|nr:VTT domain-containing protein [Cellulomons edaphi]MDM7829735.1 VTT domain-containing protein [Cellulomons edaphi]
MLTTSALAGAMPALGPDFLDPQHLIDSFGAWALVGIMAVIFIEVGLLFPILPGDSLLFTAGALLAQKSLDIPVNIAELCVLMILTAFAGTQCGYLIGRKAGPKVFSRPDSRFFKQKYIDDTYAYFDRYGGRTLVVAQFVPFVRTYASVAAGVGKMPYRQFVKFNAVGVVLWAGGVTLLGYALGTITFIADNIEMLLVVVVLLSVIPIAFEVLRERRKGRRGLLDENGRDTRYDEPAERAEVERKAFDA